MASSTAKRFAFCILACFLLMSHASAEKVNLSLYYEALCPYCANFMVNDLPKIFENHLIDVVNLRLIPWGNAQIQPNSTLTCQHGGDECLLNAIDACAIREWPQSVSFQFIHCVESLHLMGMHTEWRSCFQSLGLDPMPVDDCYNNGIAYRLEEEYADETDNLDPPQRFVPWVVINDFPLQEDYKNFMSYICKSYKGGSSLTACKSILFDAKTSTSESSSSRGCIAEYVRT